MNRLSPYNTCLLLLSLPVTLSHYFRQSTGESYGVGTVAKLLLVVRMVRNNFRIVSASNFVEHLVMATTILNIPRADEGRIVECGSYKGGSAANLSLVAALCGRQLEIFDSFGGLPEPSADDRAHTILHRRERHTYEEGAWAGTMEEVKDAIARYGAVDVCSFNAGYFDATLPAFGNKTVFVFADVDLRDSVETCVRFLWPLLSEGGTSTPTRRLIWKSRASSSIENGGAPPLGARLLGSSGLAPAWVWFPGRAAFAVRSGTASRDRNACTSRRSRNLAWLPDSREVARAHRTRRQRWRHCDVRPSSRSRGTIATSR